MRNERVEKVGDVVSEGQAVKVKVLEIDPRGKVRLSMRVVDQETGAELEDVRPAREPREERPRGDRPDRGPRKDGGRERGPRRDGGRDRGPRPERSEGGEKDGASAPLPDFITGD
jgi:polyribonucleotide nucleotidyltransferase